MKRFVFVNEGKVVSLVVADSKEKLEEVPGGSAGIELPENSPVTIGWLHDEATDTFLELEVTE